VVIAVTLLLLSIASTLRVAPHHLSYFNEIAGGPDNGSAHLIDSNIDWGQDLLYLKAWGDRNGRTSTLSLAYWNYVDPSIAGLHCGHVPPDPPIDPLSSGWVRDAVGVGPHPGCYALDIHSLTEGPYTYFNQFRPHAKAGYSIFIYMISADEAAMARRAMGLAPLPTAVLSP
jgi:hypothetical protein